jgi:hypothetical protein
MSPPGKAESPGPQLLCQVRPETKGVHGGGAALGRGRFADEGWKDHEGHAVQRAVAYRQDEERG